MEIQLKMGETNKQEEVQMLNEKFKKALLFEGNFSRFSALSRFTEDVAKSEIPAFIKERMMNTAKQHQMAIVGQAPTPEQIF